MSELLFEIGVEELPALSIEPAQIFMKDFLTKSFKEMRIPASKIETYGTPRRLVVQVCDLAIKQEDLEEEVLGPSTSLAFSDGGLSKAGLGFIKAKGVSETDVYRKVTDKGEVIAARVRKASALTKDLLPALLIDMMRQIPFKKRMRWESTNETFARPILSLLCLFNREYLSMQFAGVTSSDSTVGHRFMNPESFKVTSIEQYHQELAARHVILSSKERETIFLSMAQEKLKAIQGQLKIDDDLIAIVRNLVEYPFVVMGSFEKSYLDIPHEILISEMKTHQKCFAVYDRDGRLMPYFICSAATLPFDEEIFAKGNARVLRARFADGAFYFAEDKKKSLALHAQQLQGLIFERELGSIADKSLRIERIAMDLAGHLNITDKEKQIIKLSAPLLKADLTTGVVGQFPELQGIMGRIYSQGEVMPDVGECIETHYWPRNAYDHLPRLKSAALLSIADKIDTVVGIIAIGKRPTGNKDPFALRRAAIGIVRMLVDFGFSIDVDALVKTAVKSYGQLFSAKEDSITKEAMEFILQRARGLLIEDLSKDSEEYAVSFADSVMAVGRNDLLDMFARAHTLLAMRTKSSEEFESLVQAFKRASNIVKKAKASGEHITPTGGDQIFQANAEKDLFLAVCDAKKVIDRPLDSQLDFAALRSIYVEIFSHMARVKPKLDAFFDGVMVMVDEPTLRNARLSLLSEIKNTADKIADFTHL